MPVDSLHTSSCYYQWQMATSNFQIHIKIKELFPFFFKTMLNDILKSEQKPHMRILCVNVKIHDYLEKHTHIRPMKDL